MGKNYKTAPISCKSYGQHQTASMLTNVPECFGIHKSEQDMVGLPCNLSYLGGGGRRMESSRPVQAKLARPYLKNKIKTQRARYVVDSLPSMHKALVSSLVLKKKKKGREGGREREREKKEGWLQSQPFLLL
jgi:hypothetical protein